MTEQEIRHLVREVLARRTLAPPPPSPVAGHASHAMFVLPTGMDQSGPCIIEPAVPCTHCGYCKSQGY
jgi:hypothetical protein